MPIAILLTPVVEERERIPSSHLDPVLITKETQIMVKEEVMSYDV